MANTSGFYIGELVKVSRRRISETEAQFWVAKVTTEPGEGWEQYRGVWVDQSADPPTSPIQISGGTLFDFKQIGQREVDRLIGEDDDG
jgi:hypothetical protein